MKITRQRLKQIIKEELEYSGVGRTKWQPEKHVSPGGVESWYLNGKRHNPNGPALVYPDGHEQWYLDDELHREDGPAISDPDGTQQWYLYGKRHNPNGPAVVYPDGTQEWWLNGERVKVKRNK